jgi:5,10-methylenetetrahydromethanopterin reductase
MRQKAGYDMIEHPFGRADLGIAFPGGLDPETTRTIAQRAEALGFGSCWVPEDYFDGGSMATIGALAVWTSRIQLGIGLVNPFTRSPALLAMEAASADLLSHGRFTLTLGASVRAWMEDQQGIPYEKPATRTDEAIQMVHQLLSSGTLEHEGPCFRTHGVHLNFSPFRRDLPVWMGAGGPRAMALAGAHADGVLLSVMSSAPYAAWARKRVDASARSAGRTAHLPIAVYLPLYVGDPEAGRRAFANTLGAYLTHSADRAILQESGAAPREIADAAARIRAGEDPADAIPLELADRYTLFGSPAHCRERLEEYRAAGVDFPIFCTCDGVSALQMLEFAEELFPRENGKDECKHVAQR